MLQPISPFKSLGRRFIIIDRGMKINISRIILLVALLAPNWLISQDFCVQIAAYDVQQPASFFKERGVDQYTESADNSGIFWYSAGRYTTREEAETIQQDMIFKGFANALILDAAEQRLLSDADCPYIRDGVVFIHDPSYNPTERSIYFDSGQSSLDAESKDILNEVYQEMNQKPGCTLKIRGFTDGVGDGVANLKLAATRSRAARDYLIYKGVRADRMFMEVFGEAIPAAPNAEDDGSNSGKGRDLPGNRKLNRRVILKLEEPVKAPKAN